jgi:hypothetical protein
MRSRAWIWSIPVAGLTGFIVLLLRGAIDLADDTPSDVEQLSSAAMLSYHYWLIAAYVMPIPGFMIIYMESLSRNKSSVISFVGLVLLVWGTALALPALGNLAFIPPAINNIEAGGARLGMVIVREAIVGPGMPLGIVAAMSYTLGAILLAGTVWQYFQRAKPAALLFGVHGLLLSFGFSFYPMLLAGWLALMAGGTGIAMSLRRE